MAAHRRQANRTYCPLGGGLLGRVQRLALVLRARNALVGLLRLLMLLVVRRLGVDRPQVMLRTAS